MLGLEEGTRRGQGWGQDTGSSNAMGQGVHFICGSVGQKVTQVHFDFIGKLRLSQG